MKKIEIISGWGIRRAKPPLFPGCPDKAWYLSRVGTASHVWSRNHGLAGIWLSKAIAETAAKQLGLSSKEFTVIEIERAQPYEDPFDGQA